ncbi:hypothetical protein TVAG_486850 [Trichomonas vaginalis G3]|uniref:Uncharacterized protein n=1 Tax=Trichomonas vaginalis (strain ATCC PRA-98 / G3) TaxID=412133 RepID=A2DZB3_TRIV3|nr:hypothetical protein TVAGG3_1017340 [Trichomonas vaginalis G3]EAY14242.1 hypothetical protein TVAG_486850 [Trichomonas vaginalis G3]KAI5491900.1 hypothetical protein TVAGG3_1017340 [Trichomonas vaginalis G3]|eukprot:XP_001326465.1 hypothetical protein [Trichomonas vaginalis G3]
MNQDNQVGVPLPEISYTDMQIFEKLFLAHRASKQFMEDLKFKLSLQNDFKQFKEYYEKAFKIINNHNKKEKALEKLLKKQEHDPETYKYWVFTKEIETYKNSPEKPECPVVLISPQFTYFIQKIFSKPLMKKLSNFTKFSTDEINIIRINIFNDAIRHLNLLPSFMKDYFNDQNVVNKLIDLITEYPELYGLQPNNQENIRKIAEHVFSDLNKIFPQGNTFLNPVPFVDTTTITQRATNQERSEFDKTVIAIFDILPFFPHYSDEQTYIKGIQPKVPRFNLINIINDIACTTNDPFSAKESDVCERIKNSTKILNTLGDQYNIDAISNLYNDIESELNTNTQILINAQKYVKQITERILIPREKSNDNNQKYLEFVSKKNHLLIYDQAFSLFIQRQNIQEKFGTGNIDKSEVSSLNSLIFDVFNANLTAIEKVTQFKFIVQDIISKTNEDTIRGAMKYILFTSNPPKMVSNILFIKEKKIDDGRIVESFSEALRELGESNLLANLKQLFPN